VLTITRHFEFDAAHRVLGHEGKCRFVHGHRYGLDVTVQSNRDLDGLDHLGRVVDFSRVKKIVQKWIDENWDHNILLCRNDPIARYFDDRPPYLMHGNPTAENMAYEVFEKLGPLIRAEQAQCFVLSHVRIYETPNCWADLTIED